MSTPELLETDNGSALNCAVRLEAGNWKAVGSAYAAAASHIATLFAAEDTDAIHLYLCDAQDRTTDPTVWNRVCNALFRSPGNALAVLPDPLKMVSIRDFRPTHRSKKALFEVASAADVKAAAKEVAEQAKAKAAGIEQRAADEKIAAQAAADAAITPADVASGAWAEIMRLRFTADQATDVIDNLLGTLAFGHFDKWCQLIDAKARDLADLRAVRQREAA